MTTDRTPVRATLAAGIVFGVAYLAAVPLLRPEQVGVATDVYYLAAKTALAGENPYLVAPPDNPGFRFLYQPIVVLAFVPHALSGSPFGAYALQTGLNLVTAGAIGFVLVRSIERAGVSLDRRDRLLIPGFTLASVHSVSVFAMGQVNLQLALAVAAGALFLDRHRQSVSGVSFALAATVKLFPAVVGVWLLRRRAYRAVGAAVVTGLSASLAGTLVFGPSLFETFLTEVVPAERHAAEFAGGLPPSAMYVTVRRPLAALLPAAEPTTLSIVTLAVLVPAVVGASWNVSTHRGSLVALLATLLGTVIYLPLEPFYFALLYYPLVPLLYLLDPGRVRRVFVAGTTLLSTVVSYQAVADTLALVPLSPGTESFVTGTIRTMFSIAQPPLIGAMLLLVGCVLFQYEAASDRVAADDTVGPSVE